MDPSSQASPVPPYPYDDSSIRELLKRKRKARAIKACFPCRHRKVRCDGNVPCASCIARNHTDLCRIQGTASDIPTYIQVPAAQQYAPQSTSASTSPREPVVQGYNGIVDNGPQANQFANPPYTAPLYGLNPNPALEDLDVTIDRLDRIEQEISSLKADLIRRRQAETSTPPAGRVHTPQAHSNPRLNDVRATNTRHATPVTSATSPGTRFVEDSTGATIYLGNYSDPPLALGCRRATDGGLAGPVLDQLMPRTYPFTDIWRPVVRAEEICQGLPSDSDILRYWQIYQTYVYPFYPALVTLEQFSISLFEFLDQRSAINRGDFSYDEVNAQWLALFFAVLALGVQFSDDSIKERDLRSKVFICSSFQFLRISNILHNIDMNQIQAMALIGHFLRNNQDTNSAWVFMGATVRLAQSIGLHEEAMSNEPPDSFTSDRFLRRRFWFMLTWQDTFLSVTYDRPSMPINPHCPIPYTTEPANSSSSTAGRSFAECVFECCQILQERTDRFRASIPLTQKEHLQLTFGYKQRFQRVLESAAPFLTQKNYCRTMKDHLERLALQIHVGYGSCRFLRFYLQSVSPNAGQSDPELQDIHHSLSQECAWKSVDVVESFLDMHRFSSAVCRSWAFVHNAVSCAIALDAVGGHVGRQRVEDLIGRLTAVLEREERLSEWCDADTNKRHYGPYFRALRALKETFALGDRDASGAERGLEYWEFH